MSFTPGAGERNNPLFFDPAPQPGDQSMPRQIPKMPQASWSTKDDPAWTAVIAGGFEWYWRSPVFDLRPEYQTGDNLVSSAIPINRSAGLGAGAYLRVLVKAEPSGNFLHAPAIAAGLTCEFLECGNDHVPANMPATAQVPVYALSQFQDCTDLIRAGGTTVNLFGQTYVGASSLYFSPPCEGLRFWQVILHFQSPWAYIIPLQASVY